MRTRSPRFNMAQRLPGSSRGRRGSPAPATGLRVRRSSPRWKNRSARRWIARSTPARSAGGDLPAGHDSSREELSWRGCGARRSPPSWKQPPPRQAARPAPSPPAWVHTRRRRNARPPPSGLSRRLGRNAVECAGFLSPRGLVHLRRGEGRWWMRRQRSQHAGSTQALRRLRPLLRRRLRMARPARVDIRLRKPWSRLRLRLLG